MLTARISIAALSLVALAACSSSDSSSTGPSQLPAAPSASASAPAAGGQTMTLDTNRGKIVIAMDPAAVETDKSFTALSAKGFFDDTICHRLTTSGIYVLQCGDPEGNGTGGPGYTIPDENLPAAGENNYPAGTVAMANAGPNTGGSQFFIVYEDTTLPPNYTIWGTVSEGLDVVQKVAKAGVEGGGPDGPPAEKVVIKSTKVS